MSRRNVTEEMLKTNLQLDADSQLDLILQSVAPTIRVIHKRAMERQQLSKEDIDLLAKATMILMRIKGATGETDDPPDLSKLSTEELRKHTK